MDAVREESKARYMAYSHGRYRADHRGSEMLLWDELAKKHISLVNGYYHLKAYDLGEPIYLDDGKTVIGKRLTEQQAYLLTHKPLHIDLLDILSNWDKIEILAEDKPVDYNDEHPFYHRNNIYWKFKIEHRNYPGYYYIPGYTRYIINEDGEILNHYEVKGDPIAYDISHTGYKRVRIVSDSGRTKLASVHRLLGYTFLDWGLNVMDLTIDHQNANRQDNSLSNLKWMSLEENIRLAHARNKGRKNTANGILLKVNGQFIEVEEAPKVVVYDLKENLRNVCDSVADVSLITDIKETAIHNHLKERLTPYGVIGDKYLIVYKLGDLDTPLYPNKIHEIKDQIIYRAGSQKRKVLILNLDTKEIIEYPSASQVYFKLVHKPGYECLTKKVVENSLKANPLRIVGGKFVLKYSDNDLPWPEK